MKLEITELDTPKKQTICLNMIVKDEGHIIAKTLQNICNNIDITYWVISDTGSTDNTKEIIQRFFSEKNIPGEMFDNKWQDFGHNRSLALKHAYNKTDYLLIFDADDSFHGTIKLPDNLDADLYRLKFGGCGGSFVYNRPLLINNKKRFKFKGVLHEFLEPEDTNNIKNVLIEGDYYIESGKTGARSKDPEKYSKDAIILEKAFNEENDGSLKDRYAFYCAQSYKDSGNKEKAIEWYKLCLAGNNWDQEKYYSSYMISHLYKALGKNADAIHYALKTMEYDIHRIEGVVFACTLYQKQGMHNMIIALYEQFKNYKTNSKHLAMKLFVDKSMYMGKFEFLVSVSAFYSDKPEIGYVVTRDLIIETREAQIALLSLGNLRFYLKYFNEHKGFELLLSFYNIVNQMPTVESYHHETLQFIKNKIKPKLDDKQCKQLKILEDTYGNKYNIYPKNKKQSIAIYSGFSKIRYNGKNYSDKKIGGSEIAAINIAENLAGQYNVYYTGYNIEPVTHNGVMYISVEQLRDLLDKEVIDNMIVVRYINFFTNFRNTARKTYLWLHDTVPSPWINGKAIQNSGYDLIHNLQDKIDKIICLSPWHYNKVLKDSRLSPAKLAIIGNGLNNNEFKDVVVRKKNRFIYASAADRSLALIVNIFPKIVEKIPDAELHIFSDADDKIKEEIKGKDFFVYHGRVTHEQIIKEFQQSDIMLYLPLQFCETYCICALEAQRAGCLCFVSNLGSLPDVVGERGIIFKNGDDVIKIITETLNDENLINSKRKLMREWSVNQSWENRSKKWLELFGSDNDESYLKIPIFNEQELDFNNDIPPTIMINLDRRRDRLNNFKTNNLDYFPNMARFSAIDGNSFDFTPYISLFEGNDFNYRKGVLGCALSHYKIWQHLSKANCKDDDFLLVLEDDIKLSEDFSEKYKCVLTDSKNDSNWDLIFIHTYPFDSFGTIPNLDKGTNKINDKFTELLPIKWQNWAPGTGAYLIRKRAATKLVLLAKEQKIKRAIDCFLMDHFNNIKTYKCEQSLIHSEIARTTKNDSDIQNNMDCYPINQIKKESLSKD